jgi:hypothetical protein
LAKLPVGVSESGKKRQKDGEMSPAERRRYQFVMAAGFFMAAVAIASAASIALGAERTPTTIAITGPQSSQTGLLESGKLKLTVEADGPGAVRLQGWARRQAAGATPKPITDPATVGFDGADTRKVGLELTARGRQLVRSCAARTLILRVQFEPSGGSGRSSTTLRRDSAACTD